ncbi:MAG: hypothetical protein O2779_01690 [Nanoarchaeota archaeon]|nr:hypothetical protein [Nanoarchaeota archaeon]
MGLERWFANIGRKCVLEEKVTLSSAKQKIIAAKQLGIDGTIEVSNHGNGKTSNYSGMAQLGTYLIQHFEGPKQNHVSGNHQVYRGSGYDRHYFDMDYSEESGLRGDFTPITIACLTKTPERTTGVVARK